MIGKWDGIRENCEGFEQQTLGEKLKEASEKYKNKIGFIDDQNQVSFLQMQTQVEILANVFLKEGLKKGDIVLMQIPNNLFFVRVFFALANIGVIPVLLLPAHRRKDIEGIISFTKPKAYFYMSDHKSKGFEDEAIAIWREYLGDGSFFGVDYLENSLRIKASEQDKLLHCDKPTYKDLAMLLLSGGTTGIPKLIPRTHGDYIFCCKSCADRCKWDENSVFLSGLPLAHNFALSSPGLVGAVLCGTKVVITEYAYPSDLMDMIDEFGVSDMCVVPMLANQCARYIEAQENSLKDKNIFEKNDISSLKHILVGGSVFTKNEAQRVDTSFSAEIIQVFGMAEGLVCMTKLNDSKKNLLETQGFPCSKYDMVKIVDENMLEVKDGCSGQIITKGPYTITDYFNRKTDSFTEDGWYKTGDKGYLTNEGYIVVEGRVSEMINRAGEKIIPSDLEEKIGALEEIIAVSVVGIPDAVLGNKIGVFVITDNENCNLSYLRKKLTGMGVSEYRLPDVMYLLKEFPLTAVGKVNKNALKEYACKKEKQHV